MASEKEQAIRGQAVAISSLVWQMVGEHKPDADELIDYIRRGDFPAGREEVIEPYNPQLLQSLHDKGIF